MDAFCRFEWTNLDCPDTHRSRCCARNRQSRGMEDYFLLPSPAVVGAAKLQNRESVRLLHSQGPARPRLRAPDSILYGHAKCLWYSVRPWIITMRGHGDGYLMFPRRQAPTAEVSEGRPQLPLRMPALPSSRGRGAFPRPSLIKLVSLSQCRISDHLVQALRKSYLLELLIHIFLATHSSRSHSTLLSSR